MMPQKVIELLVCCKRGFAKCGSGVIWGAVSLWLMWNIWKKCNELAFEDLE